MRGIKLITSETVAAVASNLVVVLLVGLLLTIPGRRQRKVPLKRLRWMNKSYDSIIKDATLKLPRWLSVYSRFGKRCSVKIILMLQRR
jgi:hypothetical protein